MSDKFSNIKVGDQVALKVASRQHYDILVVKKVTSKQFTAGTQSIRKSDGKVLGESYRYAEVATPELIDKHAAQVNEMARTRVAREALNDLEGKHLHQLKLSLPQLEALAKAWTDVKAMGASS